MVLKDVSYLKIETLIDFEAQPFKVLDDDAMYELAESIKNGWCPCSNNS